MDPRNGGPCEGIRNSIFAQKALGIDNEVLSFDSPDKNYLLTDSFKTHAIGPVKGPYCYSSELKKWLRKNLLNYDVVIIHGIWLYNSYGTFRVWKKIKDGGTKVPQLYIMPHGMLDPYFQKSKNRRLKAIRNWFFWKLVEEKVINGADGVLFTCEEELLLARKTFKPYRPQNELNIGYGVRNPPEFQEAFITKFREKCPSLNNRPYLLFLSRIHPKKGVWNLVNAYLKLKGENHNIPDLVIAGPGIQTSFGKKIYRMAEGNSVHFPGMLEGSAKWAAFYCCEAFILPSHQENFGIAVVEALACGKPVLISKQVNIWREIERGAGGLITSDTEDETYEMLKQWISLSKQIKREMGQNAANIYQMHYTIEKATGKMLTEMKLPTVTVTF